MGWRNVVKRECDVVLENCMYFAVPPGINKIAFLCIESLHKVVHNLLYFVVSVFEDVTDFVIHGFQVFKLASLRN